jgi:hypothetical protein
MKHTMRAAKILILLLGLMAPLGCGISGANLVATLEPMVRSTVAVEAGWTTDASVETAVPATLTAVACTHKMALLSFHGRWVTAMGQGDHWLLSQEPELKECGWFSPHCLDNGKVALETCHGRYITAPISGATRQDWLLWQEIELVDCGQFALHESSDGVAFETCAGRFFTAGDGNWEGELAWKIVGETNTILTWELFTVLRR